MTENSRSAAGAETRLGRRFDRRGIVRHVHPGGLYAKDVSDPRARRDYEEMRMAILRLQADDAR